MTDRVVVVGDGGHARVILDILEGDSRVAIAGFTSRAGEQSGDLLGYPNLGPDEILPEIFLQGCSRAFVALGDNTRRKAVSDHLKKLGYVLVNAVSRRAVVSRHASLGSGIAVMPGAIVNAGSTVADGSILNTNSSIDHDCKIGEFAHVGPGSVLAGCVVVSSGVLLGAGCRLLPGVRVGQGTIVGAGAVVVRDLPERVVAVGVPARVIRQALPELGHD